KGEDCGGGGPRPKKTVVSTGPRLSGHIAQLGGGGGKGSRQSKLRNAGTAPRHGDGRHAAMAIGCRHPDRRKTATLCSRQRGLTQPCIPLIRTIEQRISNS